MPFGSFAFAMQSNLASLAFRSSAETSISPGAAQARVFRPALPLSFQHRCRCIAPAGAAQTAAAMDAIAAEIEVFDRRFVRRPSGHRAHEEHLVEEKLAVIEVAFGKAVGF